MGTSATLRWLHMLHTGGECKNRVGWLEEEDIHIFQPKKDPRPLTSHIPKLNHNFQNNRPCLLFFQGRPRIESPLATRARNHLIPIRRQKAQKNGVQHPLSLPRPRRREQDGTRQRGVVDHREHREAGRGHGRPYSLHRVRRLRVLLHPVYRHVKQANYTGGGSSSKCR